MGRAPCCDKTVVKRGPWSLEEDTLLKSFIHDHGTGGNWISLPRKAGLNRCGKSCRLRWLNYLRPNIRHGGFTEEEDYIICTLYSSIGSRWSVIASKLPGRTDNDVKNYWNTKLKKKIMARKVPGFDIGLIFSPPCNNINDIGLAPLDWTQFVKMNPKPETNMNDDYGASLIVPYPPASASAVQTQQEISSHDSRCSSSIEQVSGGGDDQELLMEDDIDDFWLKLLVDQSTFMGGDSQSDQGLHEKIKEFASLLDGPFTNY